jgi:hypothetical protein
MKTLSIKGVPPALHERLKQRAQQNHRSLNGELLTILEQSFYQALPVSPEKRPERLSEFLRKSPLRGAQLKLRRTQDTGREIAL